MKAKLVSLEKSITWGQENELKEVRFIAVATFVKTSEKDNKFVSASFGTNNQYRLSIDIKSVYIDDDECKNDDGNFDPELAWEKFQEEYPKIGVDDVNLYDIDLGACYLVKKTKREMRVARIASYGTEDDARAYAMRALGRDIKDHRLIKVEEKEEKEDKDF